MITYKGEVNKKVIGIIEVQYFVISNFIYLFINTLNLIILRTLGMACIILFTKIFI